MARSIEEPRNARSRRSRGALPRAARELVEEHGMAATTMAAVGEHMARLLRSTFVAGG
ncbi:hypothetical protein [Actinomadura napierensis]|uniref:hypothetical protein n=1 Tax=Actinomadura napierensis TaxID=267854 RepID=UPI0031E461E2